jgi:probable HAF family extracellular repeat protein
VVGYSTVSGVHTATEWSGGSIIDLGGLPGSTLSIADGVNDAGQAVGYSVVNGVYHATEWSGSSIIDLGPGLAEAINNAGQVVGSNNAGFATEWRDGSVIDLGVPPGFLDSVALGINDAGQVVGYSFNTVPEPSTWAMMLAGFAGLGFAGYRRAKAGGSP